MSEVENASRSILRACRDEQQNKRRRKRKGARRHPRQIPRQQESHDRPPVENIMRPSDIVAACCTDWAMTPDGEPNRMRKYPPGEPQRLVWRRVALAGRQDGSPSSRKGSNPG